MIIGYNKKQRPLLKKEFQIKDNTVKSERSKENVSYRNR